MEQSIKSTLLSSIGEVFDKSKECRLEKSFFEQIDCQLNTLSSYFMVSKQQSFFIAIVFALNYKGDTVDLKDLVEYFGCNPMELLQYSDDFVHLYEKGIFRKNASRHRINLAMMNDQFTVNDAITKAILQSESMPEVKAKNRNFDNILEVIEELHEMGNQRADKELDTVLLFAKSIAILRRSNHLPLVGKIKELLPDIEDQYFFLYLIWETIIGKEKIDINEKLEKIYDSATARVNYMQKLLSTNHILTQNDLLEIVEAPFFNDTLIKLTEKSLVSCQYTIVGYSRFSLILASVLVNCQFIVAFLLFR
jgi:hypothetical protein